MSTIYNNFTITQVSFTETEGNDLGNGVIYTLIIEPDTGYSLDVNNFALIAPYPAGIDSSSATFTQNGAQINLTIQFLAGTIMPGNDLDVPLCIQGFADAAGFSISGAVSINTLEATPLPQFVTYSNTGGLNETEVVFTETITADANYYFFTEPVMGITTGNAANYAITNSKVYNIDNQLTSITFSVSYTYPNADVSGDLLQINATAIPIIVATDYVNAYNIDQSTIPANGDTRVLSLIGDPGSVFTVILNEIGTGNATTLANNVTMPATGTYSIPGITFPVATANADPYTIVISGDINPTIANSGADVLLNFTQLSQVTFTVQATASSPVSIETPSWEFIAVPNYTYVPGQPNTLNFTFKATSSTGSLTVISTVDADSFSPVIPDPAHPATLYDIGNIVQGLDVNGDFEVSGTITIQTTEDVSIVNILDLDQIISAITLPTVVTKGISNETGTAADSGGETITDGGGTISAKGVQWSSISDFSVVDGGTNEGAGTADYVSSITGLTTGNTYYVRAFVVNEAGTAYGQVIQFVSSVTFPCGTSIPSGGVGITDINVNLDSAGGLLAFAFNGQGVPDKMEIIHGNASGTKVATTSQSASGNSGPFDNTYGTETSNTIPSGAQAIANAQFIGTDIQNPWTVTRQTEFNTDTGFSVPNMTIGGTLYQQIVWWQYTTADFQVNPIATVRITGTVGTGWDAIRLCCPDNNCTATP